MHWSGVGTAEALRSRLEKAAVMSAGLALASSDALAIYAGGGEWSFGAVVAGRCLSNKLVLSLLERGMVMIVMIFAVML